MRMKELDMRWYEGDKEDQLDGTPRKWLLESRITELEDRIEELDRYGYRGGSYRIPRSELRNVLPEDITDIHDALLALEMAEEELLEEYGGSTLYMEDYLKKQYGAAISYFDAA